MTPKRVDRCVQIWLYGVLCICISLVKPAAAAAANAVLFLLLKFGTELHKRYVVNDRYWPANIESFVFQLKELLQEEVNQMNCVAGGYWIWHWHSLSLWSFGEDKYLPRYLPTLPCRTDLHISCLLVQVIVRGIDGSAEWGYTTTSPHCFIWWW